METMKVSSSGSQNGGGPEVVGVSIEPVAAESN